MGFCITILISAHLACCTFYDKLHSLIGVRTLAIDTHTQGSPYGLIPRSVLKQNFLGDVHEILTNIIISAGGRRFSDMSSSTVVVIKSRLT